MKPFRWLLAAALSAIPNKRTAVPAQLGKHATKTHYLDVSGCVHSRKRDEKRRLRAEHGTMSGRQFVRLRKQLRRDAKAEALSTS